jgi:hypothetical protein
MSGGGASGGLRQISPEQAKKEYQALPDYAKRAESAPYGMQQFGDPQRYHLAGVAPGWFNPALDNQKQLQQLQVVEAQKRQERANRLNPPIIPPTRGAPISVSGGGPVTVPSGAFNLAPVIQSIVQSQTPAQSSNGSQIQAIRDAFINSLL